MTEQLSADDWIKEGIKILTKSGFTALKAEPLALVGKLLREDKNLDAQGADALEAIIHAAYNQLRRT